MMMAPGDLRLAIAGVLTAGLAVTIACDSADAPTAPKAVPEVHAAIAPAKPPDAPVSCTDDGTPPSQLDGTAAEHARSLADTAWHDALAAQGLTEVTPETIAIRYPRYHGGAAPSPELERRLRLSAAEMARVFDGKHTGDRVAYELPTSDASPHPKRRRVDGVFVQGDAQAWSLARRGDRYVLAIAKSTRHMTCLDPHSDVRSCGGADHALGVLVVLPAGASYGGAVTLPVEAVRVTTSSGVRDCPELP